MVMLQPSFAPWFSIAAVIPVLLRCSQAKPLIFESAIVAHIALAHKPLRTKPLTPRLDFQSSQAPHTASATR